MHIWQLIKKQSLHIALVGRKWSNNEISRLWTVDAKIDLKKKRPWKYSRINFHKFFFFQVLLYSWVQQKLDVLAKKELAYICAHK